MSDEPRDFTKQDDRDYGLITPARALDFLDGMSHVTMSENSARQIAAALGCPQCVRVVKFVDRRSEFHGFFINNDEAKEGDFARGVDPLELGESLAMFYRLPHYTFPGQGTQLHEYVRVLRAYFAKTSE
jgi:hypothetical protein